MAPGRVGGELAGLVVDMAAASSGRHRSDQARAYQPTVTVATVGLVPTSEELKPPTSS